MPLGWLWRKQVINLRTPFAFPRIKQAAQPRSPWRATMATDSSKEPEPLLKEVSGLSGRRYAIEDVLQDRNIPYGRVYLAQYVGIESPI